MKQNPQIPMEIEMMDLVFKAAAGKHCSVPDCHGTVQTNTADLCDTHERQLELAFKNWDEAKHYDMDELVEAEATAQVKRARP